MRALSPLSLWTHPVEVAAFGPHDAAHFREGRMRETPDGLDGVRGEGRGAEHRRGDVSHRRGQPSNA